MNVIKAIIFGIIQGITEFLPISSSGHLALAHAFFGAETDAPNLVFDVMLHAATLLAVVIFYRREIFSLVPAFFKMAGKVLRGKIGEIDRLERLALNLSIGSLPLVLAVWLSDFSEAAMRNLRVVGVLWILNGLVLLTGDRLGKRRLSADEMKPQSAALIGFFQLAAIFPGLSRSGMTITGGLFGGLEREEAVRFSFLLSIPAICGAVLKSVSDAGDAVLSRGEAGLLLAGMLAAACSGFCALKLINYIAGKKNFGIFAYYCMAAGVLAAVLG